MKRALTLEETQRLFLNVAQKMQTVEAMLSEADRAIGDGDHGVGMVRGFEAVEAKLTGTAVADLQGLFKAIGSALMMSIGGASGAIFGTWFRGGAKSLEGVREFDAHALYLFLRDGLAAVQDRGKAKLGEKTMVDALAPAADAACLSDGKDIDTALTAVLEASEKGLEATRGMIATLGKAKTLGERALGYPDPGALSTCTIFKFMVESLPEAASQSAE
jgi:dihydroxyacetone kinase-like protein